MSYTIKIRNKRHAAQIRKFAERVSMRDGTHNGSVWKVGNYVHMWFYLPHKEYMVWSLYSYDPRLDTLTSLRELYATQK